MRSTPAGRGRFEPLEPRSDAGRVQGNDKMLFFQHGVAFILKQGQLGRREDQPVADQAEMADADAVDARPVQGVSRACSNRVKSLAVGNARPRTRP